MSLQKEKKKSKPKRSLFRKIINAFIGMSGFLVFMILLFFAFSQTQTFRNYLRSEIISAYSNSFNGKLNIGQIKGTILTSLTLDNVSLQIENETLFNAESISLRMNPFDLFRKKLNIISVSLKEMNIKLRENEPGKWNYEELKKTDTVKIMHADSLASSDGEDDFPFIIELNKFEIVNTDISIKDFEHLDSDSIHSVINFGDLVISDLNLVSGIKVDLNKKQYELELNNLSAKLNSDVFSIDDFSGNFLLSDKFAQVSSVKLKTKLSEINLSARLDSIDLFSKINLEDFKNYPMSITLTAVPFNFDDLSAFVESTNILKGNPTLSLEAKGNFGDFEISKLNITLNETVLNARGRMTKLHTPGKLFLDVNIFNSTINESDAVRLLPGIGIPDYDELLLSNVDISFKGEPTKFNAKINAKHKKGSIKVEGFMDVSHPELLYDLSFNANDLDLGKILNTTAAVTAKGKIKGRGTEPQTLAAEFQLEARNTRIGTFTIDTLGLTSQANGKKIDLDLYSYFNNTESEIRGAMDFTNNNLPAYNLTGNINGLNINDFIDETSYNSDLNFSFVASGFDLDPDNMTGNYFVEMRESQFGGKDIGDSRLTLFLTKDGLHRSIKLNSDFIDIVFNGEFELTKAINVLAAQSGNIVQIIRNKLSELNPANIIDGSKPLVYAKRDSSIYDNVEFDYNFKLKDFELIAMLLETSEFDIAGSGKGKVKNDSATFSIDTEIALDYLLNADEENPIFISNINSDIHFARDNNSNKFSALFGSLSLSGEKIILDKEIKDINADVIFNGEKILFNSSANYGNILEAYLDGDIELTSTGEAFTLYDLSLNYKNMIWNNTEDIRFEILSDSFTVESFSLTSNNSEISLLGGMNNAGDLDFTAKAKKISGKDFTTLFFAQSDNNFLADINVDAEISGSLQKPVILSTVTFDSIGYFDNYFGKLIGNFSLIKNNLVLSLNFEDLNETADTLLTLTGNIPLRFSFLGEANEEEIPAAAKINLYSKGFNLAAFGNLIPSTKNLKGIFYADVSAHGSIEDLKYDGVLSIENGFFRLEENNLGYNYFASIKFQDDLLELKALKLENATNTKHHGIFKAKGTAKLSGFKIEDAVISGEGNLAVFSPATKELNQNIYGDLVIRSNEPWDFIYKNGRISFMGNVDLTDVDITLVPSNQINVTSSERIRYVIKSDTTKIDREENKFRKFLANQIENKAIEIEKSNFDYNFKINIVNEAKIQILLSKVWNQKLSILAKGNLEYESIGGNSRVQGAFDLQPGSKLEFVKSFDATGTIKFESDITNPYLDITALYRSSYNQGSDETPDIVDVEVELNLTGTLDKLGANLMKNPENIAIYKGAHNIENRIRDNRYDISDAILFIFYGRFKEDLTASDKSQLAGLSNTATSFLGTALSSIINSAVGDVVSAIQVDQRGLDTQIIISGRYQKIRYSVGGTTRIQNISQANLKIEYQLLPNLLFRLERKDPVDRSFGDEEKISELGLKYRIEF